MFTGLESRSVPKQGKRVKQSMATTAELEEQEMSGSSGPREQPSSAGRKKQTSGKRKKE